MSLCFLSFVLCVLFILEVCECGGLGCLCFMVVVVGCVVGCCFLFVLVVGVIGGGVLGGWGFGCVCSAASKVVLVSWFLFRVWENVLYGF